jgi:hypothetical protein
LLNVLELESAEDNIFARIKGILESQQWNNASNDSIFLLSGKEVRKLKRNEGILGSKQDDG